MSDKIISERIQSACDIATGRTAADPGCIGTQIIGAEKNLNAKGRGPEWYRLVYRRGNWEYVSRDRLPSGVYLARDRRASVSGDVFAGEVVVSHNRGGPVNACWLVASPNGEGKVLVACTFASRRDGQMAVTLPDGSEVLMPNPRKK